MSVTDEETEPVVIPDYKTATYEEVLAHCGRPKPTSRLNNDQRGWAKERFPAHWDSEDAHWWIRPEKPAVPLPATNKHGEEKPKAKRSSRKRKAAPVTVKNVEDERKAEVRKRRQRQRRSTK